MSGIQPTSTRSVSIGARRGDARGAAWATVLVFTGASLLACGGSGGGVTATRRDVTESATATSAGGTPTSSTTVGTEPVATSAAMTTAAATSAAPAVPTSPAPTSAAPAPTAPATTAPLPAGAIDLGHGVHLIPPDGWSVETDELGPIISDGVAHAALEVHVRPAGEDPAVAMQTYVDVFDADYDAVAYSPVTFRSSFGSGATTVHQYGVYYETYDEDDGLGWHGGLFALVRADGLTLLIDVWDESGGTGLPDATAEQVRQSLRAAPAVGAAVALDARAPFRLATVHDVALVDGVTGFTLAPGFEVVDDGPGWARASNGVLDAELHVLDDAGSLDAAMAEGAALVAALYDDVVDEPEDTVEDELADQGYLRRSMPWTGLWAVDGTPCGGTTTAWWAPTTGDAFVYVDGFVWMDDGSIPYEPEATFMYTSASMSLPVAEATSSITPVDAIER